jgi:hypothetical protein
LNSLTKLATAEGNTIVASTVPPCKAEIIGLSPPQCAVGEHLHLHLAITFLCNQLGKFTCTNTEWVIYRDDDRELDRALLDVGGMKVGRDAGERKQYRAQKGKNEAHRAIMRKPLSCTWKELLTRLPALSAPYPCWLSRCGEFPGSGSFRDDSGHNSQVTANRSAVHSDAISEHQIGCLFADHDGGRVRV